VIVADTNLIAYLHLPGNKNALADAVLLRDPDWCVPPLWRSEFRNILFAYIRTQGMDPALAETHWHNALTHLAPGQTEPEAARVLEKSRTTRLTAYDAEYVALAEQLNLPLVTSDKDILKSFPRIALTPEEFVQ
jgi:predicted nucleic acid-binding protein